MEKTMNVYLANLVYFYHNLIQIYKYYYLTDDLLQSNY